MINNVLGELSSLDPSHSCSLQGPEDWITVKMPKAKVTAVKLVLWTEIKYNFILNIEYSKE